MNPLRVFSKIGREIRLYRAARRLDAAPGHFYSPIPSPERIEADADRIFGPIPATIDGIDLNEQSQLELLERLRALDPQLPPWEEKKSPALRYHYKNIYFSYGDAIGLQGMMRLARPARIIEIGSGYSSAAILDVNELFFDHAIDCAFIDPDPARLRSILRPGDADRVAIIEKRQQDTAIETYSSLAAGDMLLIDSTHVCKTGGDVNRYLFEILPGLASGVLIMIHDIFYPFEYPRAWVQMGRAWNEAYVVRAFLHNNPAYRIELFTDYMTRLHRPWFESRMPRWLRNSGASLWLRKL